MKFKAELEIDVPDNATFQTIEDAKIIAERNISWHRVIEMTERLRRTNLEDKCGSCKFFTLKPDLTSCCYGKCEKGKSGYKTRSNPKCKQYERRENCTE